MRFWPALLAALWLALPFAGRAAEPVALPALQARITDLTGTLDATQRGRLEARLAAIERAGRAQIAVLLLPTTRPEAIEAFGIRLAEAWKIGRKGADDGIILIVAKDDRRMRIEVGYGLEGAVPDATARRIVAERMAPRFREGDFFGGLVAAVDALDAALGGRPAAETTAETDAAATPPAVSGATLDGEEPGWIVWLFMTVVAGGMVRAMFGLLGSLAAAAIGGWLGFMVFGTLAAALIAAALVFVLSFINVFSGGGRSSGGFSGGGGGFSGGGGSFGGGGASGGW